MGYIKRQKNLIRLLESRSIDALLVRKKQNIFYLTGARGDDAILLISGKGSFLVTDPRYREEYKKSATSCRIKIARSKNIYCHAGEALAGMRARRIGFESAAFSFLEATAFKKILKKKKLIPVMGIIEQLRVIKDSHEIECIKKACRDACSIMKYAFNVIKPGLTEKELKARLDCRIYKNGLEGAGFEIIVASGKNASMPHALASDKKINKKDVVIIDLGTINRGYNSDLTRTVFLGRIDRKCLNIYNIVKDAQQKAIDEIRPGLKASYIDSISRQYISDKGLGRYFIHSLGHGIGLETHEAPNISRSNHAILKKNMTVTIEPGIYIPGWGGVRIEDVVQLTATGCKVLTGNCRKVLWR